MIFALEHLVRNYFLQVLQSALHHCLGFSTTTGPSTDKKQDKQLVVAFSSSRPDYGSGMGYHFILIFGAPPAI